MHLDLSDISNILTLAATIAWLYVLKEQINRNSQTLEKVAEALETDRLEHVKIIERLERLESWVRKAVS